MDVVISVVAKIGEYLVAPIGRQLGYLLYYNSNIEDIKTQVNDLQTKRDGVRGRVDADERSGVVILPEVRKWLTEVDELITNESKEFFDDEKVNKGRVIVAERNGDVRKCFNCHCPDLKLRYQLSRRAKKKTTAVDELIKRPDGNSFNTLSHPAPPPTIIPPKDAEVFESRKSTSKKIMEALKDDRINMIGIYGMGGVGKTTLVKEVGKQANDDNLFDEVVMAVVSQTPNVRRIQGEIADMLGLKFGDESETGRAGRLFARLVDRKRKLVILDDIWDTVELEAIGIPFGAKHKGCKIVLTSRRQDVCYQMGSTEKNFLIGVLSEQEAWNLFQKMVGDSVDSPDLKPLAFDVAKECAGLPLAIVTVARALINKSSFDWRDAANRLRRSILEDVVSSALELSYNHLKGEETKSFFLLCSLFPEDSNIAIQDLLKYGMGLGLFQDVDTVDEARDRAHKLANDLKSACLLLDSRYEDCVKMHDVVRDFAISIASKDKHVFLVRAGPRWKEWPKKDTFEQYTAISLMSDDIHELPNELECPKLQILFLRCSHPSLQFPDNFFLRMKNLKVLDMSGMHFLSLPPSLRYLENLRTLCLDRCSLKDLSLIRELRKLEILSFVDSDIEKLPKEVGTLIHLRLLDLTNCKAQEIIIPDAIRGLSQLEDLDIVHNFYIWEMERSHFSIKWEIAELKHFSRLTTLEIDISDASCLPDDLLFKNFKISIGTRFARGDNHTYSTISTLLKDGVNVLLKKAEHLHWMGMEGLKTVPYDLAREGFRNLRCLIVEKCDEVDYIFNTTEWVLDVAFPILKKLDLSDLGNLKEICHGQLPTGCFCELQELRLSELPGLINTWKAPAQHVCFRNLRVVKVEQCDGLKHLFSYSIAKFLSKLVNLRVRGCGIMEEIFGNEKEEAAGAAMDDILFPHLRSLKLEDLPKLRNFYSKMKCLDLKGDLDTHIEGTLFNKKVAFPALEKLVIKGVNNLKSLFSPSTASSLVQLQEVDINSCEMMETIIAKEREGEENCIETIVFLQLRIVQLKNLPELVCFYKEAPQEGNLDDPIKPLFDQKVSFPTLEKLVIYGLENLKEMWHPQLPHGTPCFQNLSSIDVSTCNSLKSLFSPSVASSLVQLQQVEIDSCRMMETIIAKEREGEENCIENIVVFRQLRILQLKNLPEFVSFYKEAPQEGNLEDPIQPLFDQKVSFPALEKLVIYELGNLKEMWHPQLPHGTPCFQNLSSIDVSTCNSLKSLFSPSVASSLVQLLEVEIQSCEMMETIIAKESEVEENFIEIIMFSQLRTLVLKNLPELVSFYKEASQEGNLDDPIQPLFDQKVSFPALEKLEISALDNLKEMWHPQLPHGTPFFQNLSSIYIYDCNSLKSLFSPSVASSLVQLLEVEIKSCEMMETIIAKEREGEENFREIIMFSQLRTLVLKNLPEIVSFYKEASQEGNLDDPIQPLFDQKVSFPSLEKLVIYGLDNLKEMWYPQLPHGTPCFQNLRSIDISTCNSLKNLFSPSVASSLVQLQQVEIESSEMMETIIAKEREGEENFIENIIVFPQLHRLQLTSLPNLMSFYKEAPQEGNLDDPIQPFFDQKVAFPYYNLEELAFFYMSGMKDIWQGQFHAPESFCKLRVLQMIGCHEILKVFQISLLQNLQNLEEVSIDDCSLLEEVFEVGGVGSEAGHAALLPRLRELRLTRLPKLMHLWKKDSQLSPNVQGQFHIRSFCKLRVLKVLGSREILNVFPISLLQNLENLEELTVEGCYSLEEVFEHGGVADKLWHAATLPELRELRLTGLPKLMHLWKKDSQLSPNVQNLTTLEVRSCGSLTFLLPSTIAKSLLQIKNIIVDDCEMMKEIIASEEGEATDETTFSQLNSLELKYLPNLTSFCQGSNTFSFPSLKKVLVKGCPQLETSSNEILSTSELEEVHVQEDEWLWKGDLNTTIQHLFIQKDKMPPKIKSKASSSQPQETRTRPTSSNRKKREEPTRKRVQHEEEIEEAVAQESVMEEENVVEEDADVDEGIAMEEDEVVEEQIDVEEDGHGGPLDLSLLNDFKDHVAYAIWSGEERGVLTFRHHYGRYSTDWVLEDEPEGVINLVNQCGLQNLVKYPKRYIDKCLISAFVERWYPETNTFHLPFGEMTITLDDVHRILGIPVVGKPLTGLGPQGMGKEHFFFWLETGLGIPRATSLEEFEKNKSFTVDLNWIIEHCSGCEEEADTETMEKTARGYLLYLLGSTLFSDKSGTRTSVYYLEVLMDLKVVREYSWGSAALTYMYRQLGLASRASVKQMAGFLPLVEVWIHDHFWLGGVPNLGFKEGEPTLNRWQSQQHVGENKKATLIGHREHLDQLSAEQVIWYPLRDAYPLQRVTWYNGCLLCFDIVEAYHPERVVRQMGQLQGIPKEPITAMSTKRSRHGKNYKVEYSILPHYLQDWESHISSVMQQGYKAMHPYDCEPEYIDWFLRISHPYVQKPENRVTGPLQNPTPHLNVMRKGMSKALELLIESEEAEEDQDPTIYAMREKEIYDALTVERRTKQRNDYR